MAASGSDSIIAEAATILEKKLGDAWTGVLVFRRFAATLMYHGGADGAST